MKRVQLGIYLEYDDSIMHSGESDHDAKGWFFNTILRGDKLELYDGEIGDFIGKVRVVKIGDVKEAS